MNTEISNILDRNSKEIDFSEFMYLLKKKKISFFIVSVLVGIVASVLTLKMPNIYRSEIVLAPALADAGIKVPGQLGGLAALAGVNLNSGSDSKVEYAIEVLKSKKFLSTFIEKHNLLVPIMASNGYDEASRQVTFDPAIYDESNKKWVRKVKKPYEQTPTVLEASIVFVKKIGISQDKTTGIYRITLDTHSPEDSKKWLEMLIHGLNEEIRLRDISGSTDSIDFLQKEVQKATNSEMRAMLYSLIEEQYKTLTIAKIKKEYILKTVDPATVPFSKESPKRSLIVVISLIVANVLLAFFVILSNVGKKIEYTGE